MPEHQEDIIAGRVKQISADLKQYVEKRMELFAIQLGEQLSGILAESIQKLSGVIFLLGGVILALIALALWLGELLESNSLGFLIVSLPLLLIGLLFSASRPRSVSRSIRKQLMIRFYAAIEAQTSKLPQLEGKSAEKEQKSTTAKN